MAAPRTARQSRADGGRSSGDAAQPPPRRGAATAETRRSHRRDSAQCRGPAAATPGAPAQTIRYMFAVSKTPYEDFRYSFTFGTPGDFSTVQRPEFDAAKAAGDLDAGLGRLPILEYPRPRRTLPSRNPVHVVAASTEYPRRGRGVAAAGLRWRPPPRNIHVAAVAAIRRGDRHGMTDQPRRYNGAKIGQSKTIERFVAGETGMNGDGPVEAALVDAMCENIRDVKDMYQKAKTADDTKAEYPRPARKSIRSWRRCRGDVDSPWRRVAATTRE